MFELCKIIHFRELFSECFSDFLEYLSQSSCFLDKTFSKWFSEKFLLNFLKMFSGKLRSFQSVLRMNDLEMFRGMFSECSFSKSFFFGFISEIFEFSVNVRFDNDKRNTCLFGKSLSFEQKRDPFCKVTILHQK